MNIRKFTSKSLRTMNLFGDICGSKPLDCFEAEDVTIFLTELGQTAKAIGKGGANIKRLRAALNRDVKVIESANSVVELVRNYLYPIKTKEVREEDYVIYIKFPSARERRVVLNNNQKELKKLKFVVSRYYPEIEDVRIL